MNVGAGKWRKRRPQGGFAEKKIIGVPDFSFEAEYIAIYKYTSEYAYGESGAFQPLYETEGNVDQ